VTDIFCQHIHSLKVGRDQGLSHVEYNSFIYKDKYGYLWISSTEGVFKWNRVRTIKFGLSNGLKDSNVQSNFYEDNRNNIWFSTYTAINRIDNISSKIESFQVKKTFGHDNVDYHIYHFDEKTGLLHFAAAGSFFSINTFSREISLIRTTKSNSKRFVQKDSIILGLPMISEKGVEIYNNYESIENEATKIQNYIYGGICLQLLKSKAIPQGFYGVVEDSGKFLITNTNQGLLLTENFENYQEIFNSNSLREIYLDHDGKFWINDLENGIIGIDFRANNFITSKLPASSSGSKRNLYEGIVRSSLFQYHNNSLLVKSKDQWVSPRGLQGNSFGGIIDNSRAFSFGSGGIDEIRFEDSSYLVEHISDDIILDMAYYSPDSCLIVGSKGLLKILKTNDGGIDTIEKCKNLSHQDSGTEWYKVSCRYFIVDDMYDKGIRIVLKDERDNLWFGTTTSGLHCYNLKTNETRAFTTREGLPTNNFNLDAGKYDDGRLWFGTGKGLVVFHPDSISFDFCTPRMNIEEILVNNQYIQSDTYVGDMTDATLAYDENSLAIRGVAIDCMFSPDVKSYYRFTGVDTTWKEVKNGDYLRYDRLEPGAYKLEMYALSPNLVKSGIKSIDFTINQPYWKTWWFRLLGLMTVGGLAYGGIQLYVWNRLREERQKRLQMETQQAERNRIADELHDDLGSGLSVIRFLSEELQGSSADERTQTLVDKISSSSQQLLTSMREIIWAMDTRNDTLGRLSEQIEDYATAFLGQRNISLTYTAELSDESQVLTGEKRRNIYLISKEAIHNIAKHAESTTVIITATVGEGVLHLKITDNGQGYDQSLIKKGRGRGSMQRRADAINATLTTNSIIGEGTTVNLKYQING